MEFVAAKQAPNESLRDWADRVASIARRAFPGIEESQVSRQIILRFCQGCLDKEAGHHAFNKRPITLDEAVLWHQRSVAVFGQFAEEERTDPLGAHGKGWGDSALPIRMGLGPSPHPET